jgi:LysM repeat protein
MSPENTSKPTKLCPTCGTRLSEDATRCLVCGTDLAATGKPAKSSKAVQGSRLPQITFSIPTILGLFLLFLAIGAALVYFATQRTETVVEPTPSPTVTFTATITVTPTPTIPAPTETQLPTPTPISYKVASGDSCSTIAFRFGVSIQSIVLLNELPAACDTLFIGQDLKIPQPTPTATALPTATLSEADATREACGEVEYTVQDNDTLSSISLNYAVSISVLKEYNGLVNDTVRSGQVINIPLCQRLATPGPSPTPTPPPPYTAPNLLLPADGTSFILPGDETVTLQWASVGTLRDNEAYAVNVLDVTSGTNEKLVEYVTDTKFIIPDTIRPTDNTPHIIRWWIVPVRQTGTDKSGNPIWETAGEPSLWRDFVWQVSSAIPITPTP